METDTRLSPTTFDRRQIFRPFLERLSPIASPRALADRDLIVPRDNDPRDTGQPPIRVAFASSAELNRGAQIALVGGIGSGKTTELLLTHRILSRHADAVNIFVDLADYADLNETNTGAILATVGMRLYSLQAKTGTAPMKELIVAHTKLRELAFGKTEWVDASELAQYYDPDPELEPVDVPGVMRLRFPALRRQVKELKELLLVIAAPLLEKDAQVTLLIDGLDRLIRPERFREFAEQDLQALRTTKMTAIIVAPLLLWYDKNRFLQDYFELVKHIPAAATDPNDSAFLRQILERRGALELMDAAEINMVAKHSGGVLRDLLTLTRTAAENAYRGDENRIARKHVLSAVKQLGNRYLVGLGNTHKRLIRRLADNSEFPIEDSTARELLVNRQVLEYFSRGREFFAVHPALSRVLPKPA
jgi:hypothetical protein